MTITLLHLQIKSFTLFPPAYSSSSSRSPSSLCICPGRETEERGSAQKGRLQDRQNTRAKMSLIQWKYCGCFRGRSPVYIIYRVKNINTILDVLDSHIADRHVTFLEKRQLKSTVQLFNSANYFLKKGALTEAGLGIATQLNLPRHCSD